jgi:Flp pilus assembly protein TadG
MRGLFHKFRQFFDRKDGRSGNVAIIFSIAIIPLIGGIGAAMDYAVANSNKVAMQKALDATALALAKLMPLTQAELDAKGWQIFSANLPQMEAVITQADLVIAAPSTGKLDLSVNGKYNAQMVALLGIEHFPVSARAQVQWGMKKLEMVLVLDVTGSMDNQNRMVELKKATKNLLSTLKSAAKTPDDVKVSIVPFAGQVNVDNANVNAAWLDWTEWDAAPSILTTWIANNTTTWEQTGPGSLCPFTNSTHGFRCTAGPASKTNDSTVSNIPSSGTHTGKICPGRDSGGQNSVMIGRYYNGCYTSVQKTRVVASGSTATCGTHVNCVCTSSGTKKSITYTCTQTYYEHTWTSNARTTWDGCVRDRPQSHDVQDTVPVDAATRFQPFQNYYCPATAMLPLTNNWTNLNNKVDALESLGATNITIGLAWGFHAITSALPLTDASASSPDISKVIILMTDGDNTINRWSGNGSNACTDCDARTQLVCTNIKAAGVGLYTVRMIDGNATLLRNCATDPSMYFDVQQSSQLNAVFNSIGETLAKLHLSQ